MIKKLAIALAVLLSSTLAVADQETAEAKYKAEVAVAFGSVTVGYTSILTNTSRLVSCIFTNGTDAAVSFDNGTNAIISGLPAGLSYVAVWGQFGRDVRTDIRLKYTVGAPTSGTVYVNCFY